MGLALRDPEYHTYGDYLTWPENVRYELIDGDAYLMAPAPTVSHQDIAGEVYRQLGNALHGKPCRALIAPVDVRLPKADEADERIDLALDGSLGQHARRLLERCRGEEGIRRERSLGDT